MKKAHNHYNIGDIVWTSTWASKPMGKFALYDEDMDIYYEAAYYAVPEPQTLTIIGVFERNGKIHYNLDNPSYSHAFSYTTETMEIYNTEQDAMPQSKTKANQQNKDVYKSIVKRIKFYQEYAKLLKEKI